MLIIGPRFSGAPNGPPPIRACGHPQIKSTAPCCVSCSRFQRTTWGSNFVFSKPLLTFTTGFAFLNAAMPAAVTLVSST